MEDYGNLLEELVNDHNEKLKNLEEKLLQITKENEEIATESKKKAETFELCLGYHNKNYRDLEKTLLNQGKENWETKRIQTSIKDATDEEIVIGENLTSKTDTLPKTSINQQSENSAKIIKTKLHFSSTAPPASKSLRHQNPRTTDDLDENLKLTHKSKAKVTLKSVQNSPSSSPAPTAAKKSRRNV